MVYAKRTTGSKIVLDALNELFGDVGHVEPHFGLYGGTVTLGAR
jgi:hypothetical protein